MNEDPFKKEQLVVRIEIAGPEDWKAYKEMRLLAITGKDKEMFGVTSDSKHVEGELGRADADWKNDLSVDKRDQFVILAWKGSEAIGMIRAKETEKMGWYLTSGYVKEDSRGKVFVPKVLSEVAKEVKKRGGFKLSMGVKAHNKIMISIATLLGFKKVESESYGPGFYMELDLENKEK